MVYVSIMKCVCFVRTSEMHYIIKEDIDPSLVHGPYHTDYDCILSTSSNSAVS